MRRQRVGIEIAVAQIADEAVAMKNAARDKEHVRPVVDGADKAVESIGHKAARSREDARGKCAVECVRIFPDRREHRVHVVGADLVVIAEHDEPRRPRCFEATNDIRRHADVDGMTKAFHRVIFVPARSAQKIGDGRRRSIVEDEQRAFRPELRHEEAQRRAQLLGPVKRRDGDGQVRFRHRRGAAVVSKNCGRSKRSTGLRRTT